jgi:hypothetical protein
MRTGWQPDALWALFDGGPFGHAHQHEDKLNLLIHAYGRLLLTEAGNYAYDASEMRRYVLSTRGHNTIRVDGHDQNRRAAFRREAQDIRRPAGARWYTSPEYDLVEAEYNEGYGPEADRAIAHRRRVIFLKRPPAPLAPCFLVIDRLLASDDISHTYQALWHFNTETAAMLSREQESVLIASQDPGQSNLTIVVAGLPGLAAALVEGQERPEWQGWKSILNNQQGQYRPAPTADIRWQARGPARLATLLYPTAPGAACPVVALRAGASVEAVDVCLRLEDGSQIELGMIDLNLT